MYQKQLKHQKNDEVVTRDYFDVTPEVLHSLVILCVRNEGGFFISNEHLPIYNDKKSLVKTKAIMKYVKLNRSLYYDIVPLLDINNLDVDRD